MATCETCRHWHRLLKDGNSGLCMHPNYDSAWPNPLRHMAKDATCPDYAQQADMKEKPHG